MKREKHSLNSSCSLSIGLASTWYHNLPVQVLVQIFKHFTEEELRTSISPVCKQWRNASLRPELWKKMQVFGEDVPTHFICRRIRNLPKLETILLHKIAEPTVVIRQICRCVPHLKHLTIRDCSLIPEAALRNLIYCCRKLESLNLSGTSFKAKRFYEEIAGLINFRKVNLSKNSCLSVHNLMSVVLNCRKLEELQLSTFRPLTPLEQLGDEDASFLISNLAPVIRSLVLDTSTLTNFSFKVFSSVAYGMCVNVENKAIMQCSKLEKLGLYGAANLSADVFTNIWKHLPKLKVLKVRNALQITGQNISDLFISGKHIMQQIVVIDFTGCWKITDAGIEAIADCCKDLKSLTLKSCKSLHSLQAVHDKCTKIEKLNVAFCSNLDLQTILPLPTSIHILIIDKSDKFTNFCRPLLPEKPDLCIKMSLSQYNTQMENYSLN